MMIRASSEHLRRLLSVAMVLLLGACGGIPLDASAPAGFDLAGHWVLDREASVAGVATSGGMRSGFMAQDYPLLMASEMRIEQDARSMGIEYARGNYRDVTWGERRRGVWQVRAGWHEGDLHIFSEASDTSAEEVWQLSENGERLDINIDVRGERKIEFRRVFRRSSGS